jgi:hypothetical protein
MTALKEMIVVYLPWLLSALTVWSLWLAGDDHRYAWWLALANRVLWFIWIFASQNWGFIPMHIALCFVYSRNVVSQRRRLMKQ